MNNAVQVSDGLSELVAAHGDSVVRIEVGRCRGGSGIVWSTDGLIVAPAHLVEGDVTVGLGDGRSLQGKLVGRDPSTDVALLKVDENDLQPAPWADLDHTRVGQLTLLLARPGKTVRAALGMIGTLGDAFRTRWGGRIDSYLQPDGGIPQGFAGSVLLDVHGRALGMNITRLTIPTSTLKRVVDELIAHGRIRRGYLGVGVTPARLPNRAAIAVVAIDPNGPAEKDGLLVGDVILSIDGTELHGPRELAQFLADKVDVALKLSIQRGGAQIEINVTTTARQ
jgi:S1-C subfamily serine protease